MAEDGASRLERAVADLTEHRHDDLPPGPPSDLGGEVHPNRRKVRSEAETLRLADIGRSVVREREREMNSD
jgi:hypothetical protein